MAAGNHPKFKVSIKPKDGGGGRISICAAWDNNGKLSASLDRRIVELAVKLDDGSVVRVKRDADGKPDHWIDVFEENGGGPRQAAPPNANAAKQAAKKMVDEVFGGDVSGALPDDFGTDDLPF